MRMGKLEKLRRGEMAPERADAKSKPKHAAAASVVGKLSPDVVATYFAPEMLIRATEGLERYSEDVLLYQDLLKEFENQTTEANVDANGNVNQDPETPVAPKTPVFSSQHRVKELEEMLLDTSNYFQDKKGGWKVRAKAARFERLMDEKYGIFRPFLKNHPEVEQLVRTVQRKYTEGQFSPFRQGKPPIPKSTAVILLFMMQRGNVGWQITTLSVLFFLVGLQPWALVLLIAGSHLFQENLRKKPKKPMKSNVKVTEPLSVEKDGKDITMQPVGQKLGEKEEISSSEYDTIILGSGPATLYTGALLSRAGRKVLVLCSKADASGCYNIEGGEGPEIEKFRDVPFDVESSNVSKVSRQQSLLAPALCSSTDVQGGIRFAQVGSSADGHAFEILNVPGMGADKGDSLEPFVLRANGVTSLMEDAATLLNDDWPGLDGDAGNSQTGLYAATCEAINASSNQFYLSKVLPEGINGMRSASTYQEVGIRYASSFLDKGFPTNPHTRSLMAAIGMKGENIKPSMTSMAASVTNICSALSGEGMHYPIGGPRALCHALATVIEQNGGKILTEVPISELIFEKTTKQEAAAKTSKSKEDSEGPAPRCIGIELKDKRVVKLDTQKIESKGYQPAIVSMHGFITTFIRLLPEEVRAEHKVPMGLPALSERRPVFKILFALDGSASDLDLTGADFYRVPGAAVAQDEVDYLTGEVRQGEIGWVDDDGSPEVTVQDVNNEPTDNPQGSETRRDKKGNVITFQKRKKRVKFDAGSSWIQISFPSAKDPSFEKRHGQISTCVVTIEADDDFVTPFDTKPKLFSVQKAKGESSGDCQRLMERVKRDLLDTYPQLDGKIVHSQLTGPILCGLSHMPERYAAKGLRPESPYPGLYLGGCDLTVGDSFSGSIVGGWLAANAVMRYNVLDYLFLQKNITSDLSRYLEMPEGTDEGLFYTEKSENDTDRSDPET